MAGQTVTIASAALLQRVTDAISRAGGNVVSSEVAPQDSHSADGFVRIIATCEIEQKALQRIALRHRGRDAVLIRRSVRRPGSNLGQRKRPNANHAYDLWIVGRSKNLMTVRATTGPTLVTLAIFASVCWCTSALAQAVSVPEQDAIQQPSTRGDLETANANPDEFSRPSAPTRSRVLDVFSSQDASERANPLWAIPLESLSATRERPIFSPSRRPPLGNVMPIPIVVQPDRLNLTLVGAIAGENGIAIFRDDSNKSVVRLRIGQSHSGWSLVRVTQRDATLRKNGEIATVALPTPSAH